MKKYDQLTEIKRYQIYALLKVKTTQKQIAKILKVSGSTISRELNRNKGARGYRPKQANIKALNRRKEAIKAIKMTPELINIIEKYIQQDWSPEQISGWLKKEKAICISHERIYRIFGSTKPMMVNSISISGRAKKTSWFNR